MIELTVKTLDSQNHAFTVEDDITVAQFKTRIADTVNIPAETQRIIYCGRVLHDEAKLNDYDVNGKVVHLVQRAPPSVQNQTPSNATSPQSQRNRGYRVVEPGNAMYLGSMAFPSNLMESQGIFPPLPTRSLAPSRLNVARRMLKRAEAVIRALENPQSRPSEPTPPEETQEEVTPVFEAHVLVPRNSEAIDVDEALVLSAVQDSVLGTDNVGVVRPTPRAEAQSSTSVSQEPATAQVPEADISLDNSPTVSTPEEREPEASTAANASENAQATEQPNPTASNATENVSRPSEMAELLTLLSQLQIRFSPFLERYQNFMQEDPAVPQEEVRQTQNMINRVSEVLHFLGHAYHSLSDIILKVSTPVPRALLCRPILIQHSALLQTGFPIQVEAQINFSSDLPNTPPPRVPNRQPPTDIPHPPPAPAEPAANPPTTQPNNPQFNMPFGFPFIPRASMHVESFPFDIQGMRRRNRNNNNVSTAVGQTQTTSTAEPATEPPVTTETAPTTTTTTETRSGNAAGEGNQQGRAQWPNFNDPNLEFFMEVTPESITIDSIDDAHFGDNQPYNVLHGTMNQAPPELLQSIFQMAGQIMNPNQAPQQPPVSEPTAPPLETVITVPLSTQSGGTSSQSSPASNQRGQNSQARGNTQTNPTTATHTRSTARPHVVHLAQHAMQGFDPFLPCNSHHVTSRRRIHMQNQQQNASQGATNRTPREEPPTPPNTANAQQPQPPPLIPLRNIAQAMMNSFRNVFYSQRFGPGGQGVPNIQQRSATATTGSTDGGISQGGDSVPIAQIPPMPNFIPNLQNMNFPPLDLPRDTRPTLAELSEMLMPGERMIEGQSLLMDLIYFLMRNLSIDDVINIGQGMLDPLMRIRNDIRNFFVRRVLDSSTNSASVDRGVNRLLAEMQPLFENCSSFLEVRDDIDIIRSCQMLFRARLPNIINLAVSRSPNSLRMLVDQFRITMRQFCALIVYASNDASNSVVEELFDVIYSQNTGAWRILFVVPFSHTAGARTQLRNFSSNLGVPDSILQPYIVRKADAVLPSVLNSVESNNTSGRQDEAMDVSTDTASGSASEVLPPINLENDTEPLPPVVMGSEPWHNQVPADWVPLISRDSIRQRRQPPQPPFSDAYLSGMPSKRRKIVTSTKPQGSLPQVITESVRRAVTATGLTSVAPLESVAQGAGADLGIQSAYRDMLRNSVPSTLQNSEDFTPERFPNASNYFNKQ